jgi:hypothetical protein
MSLFCHQFNGFNGNNPGRRKNSKKNQIKETAVHKGKPLANHKENSHILWIEWRNQL